jgi:hypothetical protein
MKGILKHKALVISLVALIIAGGWYVIIFRYLNHCEADLNDEFTEAVESRKSLKQRLEMAPRIMTQLRLAEHDWHSLTSELTVPDSAFKIRELVGKIAHERDVSILRMDLDFSPLLKKVSQGETMSFVEQIGLHVEARGRFIDVGNFIDALEVKSLVAGVKRARLTYQEATDPDIYLDLDMSVFIQSGEGDLL